MDRVMDPKHLAELVSTVTGTMLGLVFVPETSTTPWSALVWRTAVLTIPGDPPLTVGLSSDAAGCAALAAAMFACAPAQVDEAMQDDALSELVNMTAGLVKAELGRGAGLALPRIVHGSDAPYMASGRRSVVLRGRDLSVVLWMVEGAAPVG